MVKEGREDPACRSKPELPARDRSRCHAKFVECLGFGRETVSLFESNDKGISVRPVRGKSAFSKYRGIGNPGIGSGRKSISRWLPGLRGQ
jgi:hypothetical protein